MTSSRFPIRIIDFRGTYKGGGGPDKTILHSAALHDQEKVKVLVTYIRQPNDMEFQIPELAEKLGIHYTDFVDRSMLDWQCLRQLVQLIKKEKIELLHSHDDKTLLYSVILKYFVPGLRIMHTCHSHAEYAKESFPSSRLYRKFQLRKKIQLWLMKQHLAPIITISENTRQRLIRGGLQSNHVVVLYNGIDIEEWQRCHTRPVLREEFNLSEDDFLIGTVARITYDKDLATFYRVAQRVSAILPNARFVIVGDGYGDELDQARKDVAALELENRILFTGHRTDLKNIYTSFDLFLMTSLTEGLPNTVLEAMALEVPVVSTAVGGVPELIISGENGLLCPVGDVESLTEAVCTLLQDSRQRLEIAKKSRKRIEDTFSFSKRVQLVENMYCHFAENRDWPE